MSGSCEEHFHLCLVSVVAQKNSLDDVLQNKADTPVATVATTTFASILEMSPSWRNSWHARTSKNRRSRRTSFLCEA